MACLATAGCGDEKSGALPARHLDPRSDAVVAVDLDYDGDNWHQIERLYARAVQEGAIEGDRLTPPTLDGALAALASSAGLSFEDDLRPLLGGTLLVGVRVEPAPPISSSAQAVLDRIDESATRWSADGRPHYVGRDGKPLKGISRSDVEAAQAERSRHEPAVTATAVYRTDDADALERVLGKLRDQGLDPQPIAGVEGARRLARGVAVVGDDTLVAVVRRDDGEADRLLRERLTAAGDGPRVPELRDDLLAARAAPTLLGAWLDREELGRALDTAAGRALRSGELRVRLERDAARASARVDFEGLPAAELPLPERGPLALPAGEGIASASANQSLTTVFLARLARELYPDSRFVRRVERVERREGLRFDDEVLRQFAGPSFTVLRPARNGLTQFGARSTLRDPPAMRLLLPKLAPELPAILEALQSLGTTGLTGLLFVAPDAPLTPAALGILAAVRVTPLAGTAAEQLYEVSGLDEGGSRPGPDVVVYGMVGDAFVVASSPTLAREVAETRTEPAPAAGTRLRVDVPALVEAGLFLGRGTRLLPALVEGAEASASAQDGDVVAEAEVRWAR